MYSFEKPTVVAMVVNFSYCSAVYPVSSDNSRRAQCRGSSPAASSFPAGTYRKHGSGPRMANPFSYGPLSIGQAHNITTYMKQGSVKDVLAAALFFYKILMHNNVPFQSTIIVYASASFSPLTKRALTNSSAWKGRRSSIPSPTPIHLIGIES